MWFFCFFVLLGFLNLFFKIHVQVESTTSGPASNGETTPSAGEVNIGFYLHQCIDIICVKSFSPTFPILNLSSDILKWSRVADRYWVRYSCLLRYSNIDVKMLLCF